MMKTTVIDYEILNDKLDECKSINKALTVFMGEVANVLEELAGSQEACTICATMGERAGERIGEKIGRFDDLEEALDAFVDYTKGWYNIEIDSIEDNVVKINVLGCFVRPILKDRELPIQGALCKITRGYVTGALKAMTGQDVKYDSIVADINGICRETLIIG